MDDTDEILEKLERRALESAAEEVLEPEFNLANALGVAEGEEPIPDLTLGGYIAQHDRPPAFTGADGEPYTVGLETDEDDDDAARPFVGYLVFIRWASSGAGILGHVDSRDLSRGATADEALQGLLDLSLFEVKAELDAAIERRRVEVEGGC